MIVSLGAASACLLFPERSTEEETPIARAASGSWTFELSPVGLCVCVCVCVCVNYLKTNLRSLLITDFCNEFWVYRVLICKEVLPFGSRLGLGIRKADSYGCIYRVRRCVIGRIRKITDSSAPPTWNCV